MRKSVKTLAIFVLAAIAVAFSACGSGLTGKSYRTLAYFGTLTVIAAYDDFSAGGGAERFDSCVAEIEQTLQEIEDSISAQKGGTYISKFNEAEAGTTVEINETTYRVLLDAMRMYDLTSGAYNPAVGLLSDLWGFSPRFYEGGYVRTMPYDRDDPQAQLPDEKYINGFATLTNFGDITLSSGGGKFTATKPANVFETYSMRLDLGGIGKGYAADRAAEIMAAYGYEYGYVNLGSSSLKLMKAAEGAKSPDWSVDVASPAGTGTYAEIYASDISISTSGDFYRCYEIDGKSYSHIIDSKTGRPSESGISIATVLTGSAAEGDALSTALCVMSESEAQKFIADNNLHVLYAVADNGGYTVTSTLGGNKFKVTDKTFNVN